jgi:hypothetical protein
VKRILLIGFLSVFAAASVAGDDYPDCDVSRSMKIPFSSDYSTDVLSITITGSPCYEASLDVSITSESGDRLYHYAAPFKPHIAIQWDDPGLAADAERLVERFTDDISFDRTADLPVWLPENDYYEANYQVVQIDRTYYDELREKDWSVYTHLIHYEGWKVIAYDRERERTVVVSEGGL